MIKLLGLLAAVFCWATPGDAAAQDLEAGRLQALACATCHFIDRALATPPPPAGSGGPTLVGVVGRKAGSVRGFRYSRALKSAELVWTPENLEAFLNAPQKLVPGNVMPFAGIRDEKLRRDLIAYLATLGSSGREAAKKAP